MTTKATETTAPQDMKSEAVQTEKQIETAIATTEPTAVAPVAAATAYITGLLESIRTDFVAANDGLDMDFVRMGTWLTFNKKGIFGDKDDATITFGDSMDVVVGQGEKRWSLWGLKDSPEDGRLITACKEKADAEAELTAFLNENPDAASRYSINDIDLRYMAFVVPVSTFTPNDMPKIYLMSFAPTSTIAWGKYAMSVYQGKYKTMGIPARTGVNRVVTRLTTSEKGEGQTTWIGIDFEAVGMFNPAEYGITE